LEVTDIAEKPSDEELLKKRVAELARLTIEATDVSMKILGKKNGGLTEETAKAFEAASKRLDETAKRLREKLET